MWEDYDQLFRRLTEPEPRAGLLEKILNRLRQERRLLVIKQRLWIFSVGLALSVLAILPVFGWVRQDLVNSGFLQFFFLMISDFEVVAAVWPTFVLLLLETTPALSLALFLVLALVFLKSLESWSRNLKFFLQTKQLTN